jgi:hypothetical protein
MSQFFSPTEAVFNRLTANFSALPIVGFNDDGEDLDLDSGFVVVKVMTDASTIASIAGPTNRIRTSGTIQFYIYTGLNTGIEAGINHADTIANLFRAKSFDGVVGLNTRLAYMDKYEYNKKSLWLTLLVCGFYYDENFTVT